MRPAIVRGNTVCISVGLVRLSLSCLIAGGRRTSLIQHFILLWVLSFVNQLSPHGPVYQLTLLSHHLGYLLSLLSAKGFNQPPLTAPTPSSLVVAEGILPVSHGAFDSHLACFTMKQFVHFIDTIIPLVNLVPHRLFYCVHFQAWLSL